MASPAKRATERQATRVLLAQGDQTSLTHLKLLLGTIGYAVVVAPDGHEALKVLESPDPPGLVILEWSMPGLDGAEVCRLLRTSPNRKSLYVVVLLDWGQQKERVDALEAGADDWLGKPVDTRELRLRLQVGSRTILERALRESEERMRGAFEYAGNGMALAKTTGDFLQVNPALSEFLGYSNEELMSAGVHAIGHPNNRPSSAELLAHFLESGRRSGAYEREFLTKSGATRWALITLSTVLDGDQKPTCFFVQFNDITERKAAQDALHRSEALFRGIMENMNDLIAVRDVQSRCRYASPSHARHLGYEPKELAGTGIEQIVHPEDREVVAETLASVNRDAQARVLTCRCRHKNGSSLHVESSISLLRDARGAPDGLIAVSRVVEERIQAEQKVQAANAETELFLQSVPSVLIGLDSNGRITRWNPTAAETFGMSSPQVLGNQLADCGIKWAEPQIADEVRRWYQVEHAYRNELRFERDGQSRFLGLHVRPIPGSEPGGKCLLLTGADVTERKKLEEQLRQAQKLEAIGQLTAGVAHEINTPTQYVGDNTRFLRESWSSIAGLLELGRTVRRLAGQGVVPPELLHQYDELAEKSDIDYLLREIPAAIDQSLDGVQRVAKIVQSMKEFSHPGSEDKRAVNINKAILATINVARHEWKYVADMVTSLDPNLPPVPCLIGEFNQVILNLVINAAHAIAPAVENHSIERGTIRVATRRDGDWAEIAIEDTGAGIPEAIRSRIFEPFFTTKPAGKGTGQGLAIAHSVVVNRHQGQIWFQSEVEKGTTFFIRLPITPPPP